jgi:SAM-dependent methyltransferase
MKSFRARHGSRPGAAEDGPHGRSLEPPGRSLPFPDGSHPSSYFARAFRAAEEENYRVVLEVLPERPGASLLDLGTSEGEFTLRLAERVGAVQVSGVELIEEHARVARARGIEVHQGDLDAGLPFEDASFDVITANHVIEHVRRTDLFVSEIRRVLAPGGLACIATNNLSSWHNVGSLALGLQPMPIHVSDHVILGNPLNPEHRWAHRDLGRTHLRLFTARALNELCEYHGLRQISVRAVGYYPLPPLLARMASRLDPVHAAFMIGLFERESGEPEESLDPTDGTRES